ncbi:hypothetical protein BCON_0013g00130 [Botryotinia convoluta]|uniref:Uncharacterized protein n=1 Tax=Botryotinia convoluta TaxID=54673 RepID=A0A4Z1IP99_9HELO|nr:hypothetical protein BCON_0013g00130 [Botryotinia convoluta]
MLLKPSRFIAAVVILIVVLTHCLIAYRYFVRSSASQDLDRIPTILEVIPLPETETSTRSNKISLEPAAL